MPKYGHVSPVRVWPVYVCPCCPLQRAGGQSGDLRAIQVGRFCKCALSPSGSHGCTRLRTPLTVTPVAWRREASSSIIGHCYMPTPQGLLSRIRAIWTAGIPDLRHSSFNRRILAAMCSTVYDRCLFPAVVAGVGLRR